MFVHDTEKETVDKNVDLLTEQPKPMDYHVAVGTSYRTQNTNTEEMVKEAEVRMYEAKSQYYQNKEKQNSSKKEDRGYVYMKTGIREVDAILSVMQEHYNGIYCVSLDSDKARRILMPAYLNYAEDEEHFSKIFTKYIEEMVDPDFHRAITSFLNYDALKRQISEGNTPKITYKKTSGESVILTVYNLDNNSSTVNETLWIFTNN